MYRCPCEIQSQIWPMRAVHHIPLFLLLALDSSMPSQWKRKSSVYRLICDSRRGRGKEITSHRSYKPLRESNTSSPTSPCSSYLEVSEKVLIIRTRLQSSNLSSELMKRVRVLVVTLLHATRAILRYAPTNKLMSQSQRAGGMIGHTKHTFPQVSPFV